MELADSAVLLQRNPDLLFTPASNQKLFTSAAALALLGPAYRITTAAAADPSRRRIYLKGGGDPLLISDDLDSLASQLARQLPRGGAWTLVGDVSRFDSVYWGPGWMWDDASDPDGMGITPLTVNRNTVEVLLRAGTKREAVEQAKATLRLEGLEVTAEQEALVFLRS